MRNENAEMRNGKSKKSLRYILLAVPAFILSLPWRLYVGVVWFIGYTVPGLQLMLRRPRTPAGPKLDLSKFEPTWSDEFDGGRLDRSKWLNMANDGLDSAAEGAHKRHGGWSCLDMAQVKDGALHISSVNSARGMAGGPPGSYAAAITTRHSFRQRYGYFEARCKCPKGQGLWSAFWLHNEKVLTQVDGTGRPGTEIDVMESPFCRSRNPRRKNSIPSSLHYGSYGLFHRMKNVGRYCVADIYDSFHTYGVEWNENGYIFYIDGVESGRTRAGGVSRNEQYLILSVEHHRGGFKGLFWAGDVRKNKPEDMTDFEVDYVRAYQYKELC